jgi:hypothetical protein
LPILHPKKTKNIEIIINQPKNSNTKEQQPFIPRGMDEINYIDDKEKQLIDLLIVQGISRKPR